MCYSALVNQHIKALGLKYKARIQIDIFEDLFKLRIAGHSIKIPRAMELEFLEQPKSASELRIAKCIREFHALTIHEAKHEIVKQELRLAKAERTLLTKVTKLAQNDQRVSAKKITDLSAKIAHLQSGEISESDSRIFPGQYAPLITEVKGERIIAPFRYLLRPMGEEPKFDLKYNGAYNLRRDSLDKVFWWKNLYGRHHGFMEIQSFWENVKQNDLAGRPLEKGETPKNSVLRFDPAGLDKMLIPCIYDYNTEGEYPLQSFALITDEPNPEVAAVGHDRTPVIMKEKYIDLWLTTDKKDLKSYDVIFQDKQPTYFEHSVAA